MQKKKGKECGARLKVAYNAEARSNVAYCMEPAGKCRFHESMNKLNKEADHTEGHDKWCDSKICEGAKCDCKVEPKEGCEDKVTAQPCKKGCVLGKVLHSDCKVEPQGWRKTFVHKFLIPEKSPLCPVDDNSIQRIWGKYGISDILAFIEQVVKEETKELRSEINKLDKLANKYAKAISLMADGVPYSDLPEDLR
jgi:hypothetical protein